MLKFRELRLSNFLVYRDAAFTFDTDSTVHVIRAENGNGKTTFLRAMEWVVYGDDALPGVSNYRLHPLDHEMPVDGPVTVTVELDVTILDADEERDATIRRTSEVRPDGESWSRTSALGGFTWADGTAGERDELDTRLPWRLREFFFTDGDKATDYVGGIEDDLKAGSSNTSTSASGNVSEAIRSLLGLDLLDAVRSNASSTLAQIDAELASTSGNKPLADARQAFDDATEHASRLRENRDAADAELEDVQARLEHHEKQRDQLLQHGDPDELERRIARAERKLIQARDALTTAERAESQTLTSSGMTYSAGYEVIRDYLERAEPLIEKGVVPATYLWWVRKRLEMGECMCGYPLDDHGSDADRERHANVAAMITESEKDSQAQNHAGDLYYHLHSRLSELDTHPWLDELRETRARQTEAEASINEAEDEIADLKPRLSELEGSPVAQLREAISRLRAREAKLNTRVDALDNETKEAGDEVVATRRRLDAARRRAHAAGDLEIKAALYRDVDEVIARAKTTRTSDDVKQLSARMNELFHSMIQNLEAIQEVRVDRTDGHYEVVGVGADGERMSVAHQFNGASKRALTNAFVVALGETAGVEAPNVIDTPLGMMDPSVREAVFRVMAEECSQLIMLLTRAEIAGIESLLDKHAHVVTVTFQGGGNIANRQVEDLRSLVCECDHRHYCEVCERVGDATAGTLKRRPV